MRNTSGLTRQQRKAARKKKHAQWKEEYTPYWLDFQYTGKHGKIYYKLEFNKRGLTPVMDT